MTISLLNKEYDGEDIFDAGRDVWEAWHKQFTPAVRDIPYDNLGFFKGKFKIKIEWNEDSI